MRRGFARASARLHFEPLVPFSPVGLLITLLPFLPLSPLLLRAAQQLIPAIRAEHLEPSEKLGIRAQLFNHTTQALEDDFLCLPGPASTHVLNAISPAFTASFALADLILDQARLELDLA